MQTAKKAPLPGRPVGMYDLAAELLHFRPSACSRLHETQIRDSARIAALHHRAVGRSVPRPGIDVPVLHARHLVLIFQTEQRAVNFLRALDLVPRGFQTTPNCNGFFFFSCSFPFNQSGNFRLDQCSPARRVDPASRDNTIAAGMTARHAFLHAIHPVPHMTFLQRFDNHLAGRSESSKTSVSEGVRSARVQDYFPPNEWTLAAV